ncbi:MAG: hypothetical protein NZM35_04595 [Chitinophagales bacterium]|nr:hypothetical protein [Chitinophagales bacterium]MDW8418815.1 hypothetical protein [Chitinophagales bacterium]
MKNFFKLLACGGVSLLLVAFKPPDEGVPIDLWKGLGPNTFLARIDGLRFDARVANYVIAASENRTKIILHGNPIRENSGRVYKQKITFEYPDIYRINEAEVTFDFKGRQYRMVPGSLQLEVAKLDWAEDKRSYQLTANFECKVSGKNPGDKSELVMTIKGKICEVPVEMPVVAGGPVAKSN